MNLAQIVQSHALSFFHLSSPDLLLGFDSPARSGMSLACAADPELARGGIRLRQFGQEIIAALGGKKFIRPGRFPAAYAARSPRKNRRQIRGRVAEARADGYFGLQPFKGMLDSFQTRRRELSAISRRCSWVWSARRNLGTLRRRLCVRRCQGRSSPINRSRSAYRDFIGEAVESDSYLKVAVLSSRSDTRTASIASGRWHGSICASNWHSARRRASWRNFAARRRPRQLLASTITTLG